MTAGPIPAAGFETKENLQRRNIMKHNFIPSINIQSRFDKLVSSIRTVSNCSRYESENARSKTEKAWKDIETLTADLIRRGYDWDMFDYDGETGEIRSISTYKNGEFYKEMFI